MKAHQDEIPVIDFSAYFHAPFPTDDDFPSEQQREVSKQLDAVCRELSYFFVGGLPISSEMLSTMFKHTSDMFTTATAEEKCRKLAQISRPSHVGYTRYGLESLNVNRGGDIKESYNFKFHDDVNQDFRGCPDGFVEDGKAFWEKMLKSSDAIATAFAVALNVPTDHFINMMNTHKETALRLLHYPPLNKDESYGDRIRCGEHTDFCLFTLVYGDGPGLQVKPTSSDSWCDVPPNPTIPICTFGGLMERCANDVWKATVHRVVTPPAPTCYEKRLSLSCFYAPETHTVCFVHPNIASAEEAKYEPITTDEYFRLRLEGVGEKVTY